MKRIFPKPEISYFVRNGLAEKLSSINEIGIYGVFLSDGTKNSNLLNSEAGYLMRTKPLGVDEGGVAAGYSVLNSIILT